MSEFLQRIERIAVMVILAIAVWMPGLAKAETANMPRLFTDQQYVEDVRLNSSLDVTNPEAVLEFVLNSLPDQVTVYPTENYYYFYFYHGGVKWAGNLRFDAETRDEGKVHMSYFRDFTEWQGEETDYTVIWDSERGVDVKKQGDLLYEVTYKGRSVAFQLNQMEGVEPPASIIMESEEYLGPIFDESGIRFFLVFDAPARAFKYILDETAAVADELLKSELSPDISIGRRTGFAFLNDKYAERKVLIGVYGGNIGLNNYLDGPFDQLPDNFLKGDELRKAILVLSPELDGTIDRFGNSENDTVRYLIAPYMSYEYEYDLGAFLECGKAATPRAYYACLNISGSSRSYNSSEETKDQPPSSNTTGD